MANLGFFKIPDTNGEYLSLSEVTGITFEIGKNYQLQVQNECYLCEGAKKGGFIINKPIFIIYKPTSETLYVRVDSGDAYINIAEQV